MNILGAVKHQSKRARVLWLTGLVVIAAVTGALVYRQHHQSQAAKDKAESSSVVKSVGELYILPTNDTPTVAAISDTSQLKGQDFFKNARNGDYVLVYPKAKIALIYRKSVNKLVNVGPVNLGSNGSQSTSASH